MEIKQFEDKPLAHYSYALHSAGEVVLVDPSRDPRPYYAYAEQKGAKIVAVIETHPHADFVSSHLQIHEETGATIYVSERVGADYPHQTFDNGASFQVGKVKLAAYNTPGHSPDGITILATDSESGEQALFTGDTLFIGDVGRPDLREKAGNMQAKRQELAEAMYHSIKEVYSQFEDKAVVYPAHGAGSLCGKNMSSANSSTMGAERQGNWAFREEDKEKFVATLLDGQPFIPSYFGFNVDINKVGAANLSAALGQTKRFLYQADTGDTTIVDVRDEADFKAGHLPNSINIMARSESDKYETWLGAILQPEEPFYLLTDSLADMDELLYRTAKIGYEKQLKGIILQKSSEAADFPVLEVEDFKAHPEKYHIVDIRNTSEVETTPIFEGSQNIPLNELRDKAGEVPSDKPIVVHCAGGYRSAAGSSVLAQALNGDAKVYDLSVAVKDFQ